LSATATLWMNLKSLRSPRAIGFIKSHRSSYLPAELDRVVAWLAAGSGPVLHLAARTGALLQVPAAAVSARRTVGGIVRVV